MNLFHYVGRVLSSAMGALLLLGAMSFAGAARADVPPPEGYVESCTVEVQQSATYHCEACGTYHGEREKCVTQYASTAFTKRCQSAGASVWTEVWCRPRAAGDPRIASSASAPGAAPQAATSEAADDSCSVAAAGAARVGRTAPWALLAVALFVIGARRRTPRA